MVYSNAYGEHIRPLETILSGLRDIQPYEGKSIEGKSIEGKSKFEMMAPQSLSGSD